MQKTTGRGFPLENNNHIEDQEKIPQTIDMDTQLKEVQPGAMISQRQTGVRRVFNDFHFAFRSTDPGQRKAGGNIVKFLAALIALTLIARGTSGATLARVDLSNPARSDIVDAVTGSATVSARDTLDITAPAGLTIVEMPFGAGQSVKAGDAIAKFDMDEIQASLLKETANLDKEQLDLSKLENTDSVDTSSLDNATRNLQRVQQDYDATKTQGESDVSAAVQKLNDSLAKQLDNPDTTTLDSAKRNLQRTLEDNASAKDKDDADVAAAQAALTDVQKNGGQIVDSTSVENAWRNLTRAQEDYNTAKAKADSDVADAQNALTTARDGGADANTLAQLQAAVDDAIQRRTDNLLTASRRVEDADASYTKAQQDYDNSTAQSSTSKQTAIDNAQKALDTAKKKAEDDLVSANRKAEDAENSVAQAESNYDKNVQQNQTSLQTEIDNAKSALDAAQQKADDNLQSAQRRLEDAQVSLVSAKKDYDSKVQQASETAISNNVSIITLRQNVADSKATVDALQLLASNDGVLYADTDGVISAAKAEGSVTGSDALVSFVSAAKGFEAYVQLSSTDADKLSVGDECNVTTGGGSLYYSPTAKATVSAISVPDAQDKVQVTIRLPDANWSDGQRIEVQAIRDTSTYDLCVPLSALHSDNAGYYLLVVEQRSTVLGVENVVSRVTVNLVASDSSMAAVRGSVSRNSDIVTGSSKSVTDGDRVRVST